MQENEFEKKVRGLMGDLEITPSAPVWNYVEKRIPKSNRRRRFIAFFLLLAGFTVCGYFFYHKFSNGSFDATTDATVKTVTATRKSGGDHSAKIDIIPVDTPKATVTSASDVSMIIAGDKKPLLAKKPAAGSLQIANEYSQQINIAHADVAEAEKGNILITRESQTTIRQPENTYENNSSISIEESTVIVDTNSKNTVAVKQPDTAVTTALAENDTIQQTKEATQKINNVSKKLQWGVSGFYGRSDVVESISLITADKSYSWDGNLNSGPGSGNYNSSDSLKYANQSKNIKAKSAYAFGINIRKSLSARSNIITGIEFTHLKTQIQTGLPKDSTAVFYYNNSQTATRLENFYRPGLGSSQVNTYTIIQVPFLFNYRLNKNNKLPLNLDAGLSVAKIIASNALVYDSYNFAYYENKDLLRETQVHLLAGFNTSFRLRNNSSLQLGPQFQYGLTGLVKNNSSTQHFFTWGLQARYFIKK